MEFERMRGMKKELREDLAVVWHDDTCGAWCVAEVINHRAPEDPSAPKYVTYTELINGALRDDAIFAAFREEALLKYAASGRAGSVWSIDAVDFRPSMDSGDITKRCRLVKEDF